MFSFISYPFSYYFHPCSCQFSSMIISYLSFYFLTFLPILKKTLLYLFLLSSLDSWQSYFLTWLFLYYPVFPAVLVLLLHFSFNNLAVSHPLIILVLRSHLSSVLSSNQSSFLLAVPSNLLLLTFYNFLHVPHSQILSSNLSI